MFGMKNEQKRSMRLLKAYTDKRAAAGHMLTTQSFEENKQGAI